MSRSEETRNDIKIQLLAESHRATAKWLDGARDGNLELGKRDKEGVGLKREGRNECSLTPLLRWLLVEVPGLH